MQLQIFDFLKERVPLDVVLNLKKGDRISMVVGSVNHYDEDLVIEDVEFIEVYDLFSDVIDPNKLSSVSVKIKNYAETSTPIELIKQIQPVKRSTQ